MAGGFQRLWCSYYPSGFHLLRDGHIKDVFFIGSMYAMRLPIGTIVIPVEAGLSRPERGGALALDQRDGKARTLEHTRPRHLMAGECPRQASLRPYRCRRLHFCGYR